MRLLSVVGLCVAVMPLVPCYSISQQGTGEDKHPCRVTPVKAKAPGVCSGPAYIRFFSSGRVSHLLALECTHERTNHVHGQRKTTVEFWSAPSSSRVCR